MRTFLIGVAIILASIVGGCAVVNNLYAGQTVHSTLDGTDLHQPIPWGTNASKNATPDLGDFWYANDTYELYQCMVDNTWTKILPPSNTSGNFVVTGQLNVTDVVATGNVTGQYFLGNISLATGGSVAGGNMNYTDTRFKMGSISRDLSAANETVAYTGVGFTPSYIIFWGLGTGNWEVHSETDGTNMRFLSYSGTNFNTRTSSTDQVLYAVKSDEQTKGQNATIQSMNTDGFNLTWAKFGGDTTQTASFYYTAYR